MPGTLIKLPLRIGIGWARLVVGAAEEVTGRAISVAGRVLATVMPDGGHETAAQSAAPAAADTHAAPSAPSDDSPGDGQPVAADDLQTTVPPSGSGASQVPTSEAGAPEREPAHVSEEAELVRESAEPGAEDGAGAQVNVAEPWDGYAHMTASDIVARLEGASAAELAAVKLYESGNRARQTVMDAVDRQLRSANGGSSTH